MGTFVTLLLLSTIALPGATWFACDALVARLNPWVWSLLGFLSVLVPPFILFRLSHILAEARLIDLKVEQPWGPILGLSVIAVGWFTAYVIHKLFLKPKRVAIIGTSLNYVGGWLAVLIFLLFLSAAFHLAIYVRNTYETFEQLCLREQTGASLVRCVIASTPEAMETAFMIVSVAALLWAGIALNRKTQSAIRIAGCVLVGFILLGFGQHLDEIITDQDRSPSTNGRPHDPAPSQGFALWNVVGLGYLIRSRRVREVYGRNLLRSNQSPAGSVPT